MGGLLDRLNHHRATAEAQVFGRVPAVERDKWFAPTPIEELH